MVIGNDSLNIYLCLDAPAELRRRTWGRLLLDNTQTAQFASDAGLGLAVGVDAAGIGVQKLYWDHLLRPLWG